MGLVPHTRSDLRIQQIARYRIAGRLKDTQIAEICGLTMAGFRYLITTPQYVELEESLLSGHLSEMDMELAEDIEAMKGEFRYAVPAAARTLLEVVQQRRDLRSALTAAAEILDRDPQRTFVKAGRVSAADQGNQTPGTEFNPHAFSGPSAGLGGAADLVASMTRDATKVSTQIRVSVSTATQTSSEHAQSSSDSIKNLRSSVAPTIVVDSGESSENSGSDLPPSDVQLPLFNIEEGRF